MATNTVLDKVMRELAALEEPKMREANERGGDDHGVNLARLRALAKRLNMSSRGGRMARTSSAARAGASRPRES